jgi:hypothetical protein
MVVFKRRAIQLAVKVQVEAMGLEPTNLLTARYPALSDVLGQ